MLIRKVLKYEISAGLLLLLSFLCAVIVSNTNLYEYYLQLVYLPMAIKVGNLQTETIFLRLVNDALMAIFFLLVGLELKYHLIHGEFQQRQKVLLPIAAALGGCIVPVLFYIGFNYNKVTLDGWAIPIATDTAIVLGVLAFFKRKISNDLRAFILGFSLIDDIIAVIVLAVFYSKGLNISALWLIAGLIALLYLLNKLAIKKIWLYLAIGVLLWCAVVEAGIHGTLAGIILAGFIPLSENHEDVCSFNKLENGLNPLVNWLILPVFVFINAEMPIKELVFQELLSPLSLGIILGLFLGKQIGIYLFSYLVIKLKLSNLPANTSWGMYYAIGILGGIGFTLSIFIGSIAFYETAFLNIIRTAIVIGSLLSVIIGSIVLIFAVHFRHSNAAS